MTFSEISHLLRAKLGEQLATQLSEEDDEKSFLELGVDSVIATELIEFIRRELDPDLSVSVLFDYPNLAQLAHRLTSQDQLETPEVCRMSVVVPSINTYEPIAIVGLSGRFPGAGNVEELWRNLADGICSTREIPEE